MLCCFPVCTLWSKWFTNEVFWILHRFKADLLHISPTIWERQCLNSSGVKPFWSHRSKQLLIRTFEAESLFPAPFCVRHCFSWEQSFLVEWLKLWYSTYGQSNTGLMGRRETSKNRDYHILVWLWEGRGLSDVVFLFGLKKSKAGRDNWCSHSWRN